MADVLAIRGNLDRTTRTRDLSAQARSRQRQTGIVCRSCGSVRTAVVDTRHDGNRVRRNRQCGACGGRWTTLEIAAADLARADIAILVGDIIGALRQFADELETLHHSSLPETPKSAPSVEPTPARGASSKKPSPPQTC